MRQHIESVFFTRPKRPFLRWAGGKQQLIRAITTALPTDLWTDCDRLVEPCLGAASAFFALESPRALLSDANPQLISCFDWIKRSPDRVSRHLLTFASNHSTAHYYQTRTYYNEARPCAKRAAAFVYLNGASFNGVFRVNRLGQYNVPVGRRARLVLPSPEHLRDCSVRLSRATLRSADFETVLAEARRGDFVFLDPPYPALSRTAYFAHYTPERFGVADQMRLAKAIADLDKRGIAFFLTIVATSDTARRFRHFHQRPVSVTRYVSGNGHTYRLTELFVSNLPMSR